MIIFYSGTPGSGKSYHTAYNIWNTLISKRNVISTVDIDTDVVSKNGKKKIGEFTYIPIDELETRFLYKYAIKNHEKGKEGQTLLVIDECQIIFDSRSFQHKSRRDWVLFFSRHRHLGYNVILISQQDRLVDRQIRGMFEYEYRHRKANNYGIAFLLPFTYFMVIQFWYQNRMRIGQEFIRYKPRIAKIYDSYTMYDDYLAEFEEEFAKEMSDPPPIGETTEEIEATPPVCVDGGEGPPAARAGGNGWPIRACVETQRAAGLLKALHSATIKP